MSERQKKCVELLWLMGISVVAALMMRHGRGIRGTALILCINFGMALTSAWSAGKIFEDKSIVCMGAFLYTLAPYRFFGLGICGDYAEAVAWVALPLVICGAYRFFGTADKGYKKAAVGLAVAGAGIVLINGFEWVTAARELFGGNHGPEADFSLQEHGIYFVHYLMTYFMSGVSTNFVSEGMLGSAPLGVGFPVTLGVIVYVRMRRIGYSADRKGEAGRTDKKLRAFCDCMLITGLLIAFLSTNAFPWDDLKGSVRLYRAAVFLIRRPYRLLGAAMPCLWVAGCMGIRSGVRLLRENMTESRRKGR